MDEEATPEDQVLDEAEDVIETELDRIVIYGAIAVLAFFAVGLAIGWLSKSVKGAKPGAEG